MAFPIDPTGAPRAVKDLGRRLRYVEDEIKLLKSLRALLARGSVSGGVVTVHEILTNPASVTGYVNTDTMTWDGVGDGSNRLVMPLTYQPIAPSLQVKVNGVEIEPSEWTLVGNLLTVTAGSWWEAGEVVTAWYAYDSVSPWTPTPLPAIYRASSGGTTDGWSIPAGAEDGDLLVAAGMVDVSKTPTLNGWTLVGESDPVIHGTASGSRTYRLVIMSKVHDGTSTVPTVTAGVPQTVGMVVAFSNGRTVEAVFDTLADGLTADTPAGPSSLRVWGTLASLATLTPDVGTVVASVNGDDIDIAMTTDTDAGPRRATSSGTAGWCLGTLAVYG